MPELIHISFTQQQMDYIAQVLVQRPYAEVAVLMSDISKQVADQSNTRREPDLFQVPSVKEAS